MHAKSKRHHLGASAMTSLCQGCMETREGSQDGQVIALGCRTAFAESLLGGSRLCPPVWGRLKHRSAVGQRCCNGQHGCAAPAKRVVDCSWAIIGAPAKRRHHAKASGAEEQPQSANICRSQPSLENLTAGSETPECSTSSQRAMQAFLPIIMHMHQAGKEPRSASRSGQL